MLSTEEIRLRREIAYCIRTCECIACSMVRNVLPAIDNASPMDALNGAKLLRDAVGDIPIG